MKYFVISDVHGYYDEMMEALTNAGFEESNKDHFIISCGDAIDRGPKSKEVLEFLLKMFNQKRAILIKGNHEDLMEEAMTRGYFMNHDVHNGTIKTVSQLTGIADYDEALIEMHNNKLWGEYISNCINYYELGDYIFVHGWIPVDYRYSEDDEFQGTPEMYRPSERVYNPDWRDTIWEDDWKDARWFNGMKLWFTGIKEPNKTIVCGHWHTSWGHAYLHHDGVEWLDSIETYYIDPETGKQEPHVNYEPFYDEGIIAIDACTAVSKIVNCVVVED